MATVELGSGSREEAACVTGRGKCEPAGRAPNPVRVFSRTGVAGMFSSFNVEGGRGGGGLDTPVAISITMLAAPFSASPAVWKQKRII